MIFRFVFSLWLVAVVPAFGEKPADSTAVPDSMSAVTRIVDYIAHPILQAIVWPVETILVPGVRALIYPTVAPIQYFMNENVLDRTLSLITWDKGRLMVYPTINLTSGTGSRSGFTLRHRSLFGRDTERLSAYLLYYVNGDYKTRAYITADSLLGSGFTGRLSVEVVRVKNTSTNQPGTNSFYFYSDTSEQYHAQLQHSVFLGFKAGVGMAFRVRRFGKAPPSLLGVDTLESDFFRDPSTADALNPLGYFVPAYRGLGESFLDRIWQVGITRDTRNNENITLTGSRLGASYVYHDAGQNHDYQEVRATYNKFFKLGKERYEITNQEDRRRKGMNLEKFLEQLEYEKLKNQLLSRKVVAIQFQLARSFEVGGNSMPVYGLQTLGNDTPLRGYSGSRFRNYAVAASSMEYRFPVNPIMDGVLFDEYGVSGRTFNSMDWLGYKNSWGFGIHVRRPDIYLFRMELGFHGLSGMNFNMSVDAVY